MSLISVVSARFSQAGPVIEGVLERTGFPLIDDDVLVERAVERSGMSDSAIARAFSSRRSVFNSFTRECERALAHLKVEVAEAVARDQVVISGFGAHLIPETVSHALRVCLVADLPSRVETARRVENLEEKSAARQIRRYDEDLGVWVKEQRGHQDPWSPSLYDIVVPTDKTTVGDAVDLIVENLGNDHSVAPRRPKHDQTASRAEGHRIGNEVAVDLNQTSLNAVDD